MRVARLIIYEGSETAVLEQLGRSLPDGIRVAIQGRTPTITIATLPPALLQMFGEIPTVVADAQKTPLLLRHERTETDE